MSLGRKATAEFIGTFWLVLGGCGTAVLAGAGVGLVGISIAFGLTVLTMVYAIGHISGCHLNPAVSVGLAVGGRMPARELPAYLGAQVLGGVAAAAVLAFLASGAAGTSWEQVKAGGLAANGYAGHSPGKYALGAALVTEVVMTFFFLFVILGATSKQAPAGFAGLAIGLALTLIHLISIPVTNTSVNPARSTGPALLVGGWAIQQLWLFWVAPLIGAGIAGVAWKALSRNAD